MYQGPTPSRWSLLATALAAALTLASGAAALSLVGAHVNLVLEHPPDLGFTVARVAFAPPKGECAGELVHLLQEDFIRSGTEVVEREQLAAVMTEIDFSQSGFIDPDDTVAVGNLQGAGALVFVEVQRCTHENSRSREEHKTDDGVTYTYTVKTELFFRGSLRVVDLATARVLMTKTLEENREKSASSKDGYPEYPSAYELQDLALAGVAGQVHNLFFPWRETRKLRFFKDDKCQLEDALRLVRIGDLASAAASARKSLAACKSSKKVKPKLLARAYHNDGVTQCLLGSYDEAAATLQQAYTIHDGGPIRNAAEACRTAGQLTVDMERFERRMAAVGTSRSAAPVERARIEPPQEAPPPHPPAPAANPAPNRSAAERLQELEDLHAQGLLSDEEYDAKRQEILSAI